MSNPEFILVDGSSYLFRAFHALPPLTNKDGHPTGAIYGVINMLGKLMDTYPTKNIAVVFDAPGKTFRNEIYADYKANRPPMPDDLRVQIEPIHQIIKALGLPLIIVEGVEADDVIGTLAQQATDLDKPTLISTGDKDMAQLVNNQVTLINTMSNQLSTPETVLENFEVRPDQIIDYLALMGDTSDNIPGIPRCGKKTAAKWLKEYETLDKLVANADKIKGKIGESLRENLDQLAMSRELTTIKTDCELESNIAELVAEKPDFKKLNELFQLYQFNNWIKQLDKGNLPFSHPLIEKSPSSTESSPSTRPQDTPTHTNYTSHITILDKSQLDTWLQKLTKSKYFALDTETDSLNAMQANLVGMSFALLNENSEIDAAYLPLKHDYENAPQQLDFDETLAKIKPILENPQAKIIGQNIKYDWHILANHGIKLNGIKSDTMLESYVLNSTATRHNMDDLAAHYLNKQTTSFTAIAGKGKKQKTFNQLELETASFYAAEDAAITLELHQTINPQIQQNPELSHLLETIEIPLLSVLAQMEHHGILLDEELLEKQSQELTNKLAQLEKEAHQLAGEEFNLNSPKQLQEILFEKLELPIIKKTPKGAPSTAEPILIELAEEGHKLPKLIIENRGLAKLKSTYTDALPKQINPKTGRVHTSYQQAVASTGRLSSTEPNLQNIPVRSPEGRKIREAIIAPAGYKILAADYSQIELRIMAHLSEDKNLLKAFEQGLDIHQATAAEIFNLDLEDVTRNLRDSAKAVNFGLIYGMSAFGLANQLDIDRGLAQVYIDSYFARYPGVRTYMNTTRADAKYAGFVETLTGRRLYLPDLNARSAMMRQHAERTAINAPMQGSAADLIKIAMIQIAEWINQSDYDIKMLMQVHDELVFEVADKDLEKVQPEIRKIMESAMELAVPLVVDLASGQNWDL